jgi:precorrin-2 dehydrogenase/sirohydrochlorin ferrochelatase
VNRIPLVVDLSGQRVVCVGAGPVAASKVLPLLEEGADLVVVAPEAAGSLQAAAAEDTTALTWIRRPYESGDLDGALLAIAATGVLEVDNRVARDAATRRIFCVRTDGQGTAAFPAVVRRGPLLLTVSTSGQAPALARRIRQRLEREYGPEWGELTTLLGELRTAPEVRAALQGLDQAERRRRWRAALDALLGEAAAPVRGDQLVDAAVEPPQRDPFMRS